MLSPFRLQTLSAIGTLGLFLAGLVSPADAQVMGPGNRGVYSSGGAAGDGYSPAGPWTGYAPGTVWNGYAPAPATVVPAPTAPAPTYVAPSGTAWRGYDPGAAWRGYAPGQVYAPRTYVQRPAQARPFRGQAAVLDGPGGPSRPFREFGSGRSVPLSKPWLPGSR